jgi:hypothetical protein
MKTFISTFFTLILFVVLTVLTQVGGVLYLLFLLIARRIPWSTHWWKKWAQRTSFFLVLYLLTSLLLLPLLSPRIPLPWSGSIQPATYWTCILNRHYVNPALVPLLAEAQKDLAQEFPHFKLVYLDGNFPFWEGFPLIPHLSHDDGRKLDLTFVYERNGQFTPVSPGRVFGYGKGELPIPTEQDMAEVCRQQDYWQYDWLDRLSPEWLESKATVAPTPTHTLVAWLARHPSVEKIFLEPHLQKRWQVDAFQKVRFQGCHSVKHDDHIHFQIR